MKQEEARATKTSTRYHLCPRCFRAVPEAAHEIYCPNNGTRLLTACPHCHTHITSPYSRFCVRCGHTYAPRAEKPV